MCKVIWSTKASINYENIVMWYKEQADLSVAKSFEEHISICLKLISQNPYMAKQIEEKPKLREYVVQKYPFLISYKVENDNTIAIASILHQSRNKDIN